MPDSLFKYTKVEHVEELLCDNLMFLSPVNKLNDPYEGEILYTIEKLHELYINNCLKLILDIDYDKKFDEKIDNNHLNEYIISLTKEETKKIFDNGIDEFKNNVSIICLSECNKINPMWSHYREEHKGVCIEYDFVPDNKIKRLCFPIDYVQTSNNDFVLEQILTKGFVNHRLLSQVFLRKSQDWNYEKEW